MTGSVKFEGLLEKFEKMINDRTIPSLKNQEVFNDICKNLILSQSKPLLEFIDILLEKLMYPRKSNSLIHLLTLQGADIQRDVGYEVSDLGHPRILEIILIRQKILQIKATGNEALKSTEYTLKLLRKLNEIYLLIVNLLQVLSDHIEIPSHSHFYRQIVTESISDFQTAFETFNSLDFIFQTLLRSVAKFGISDDRIFHVDENLLSKIKTFSDDNLIWYESLMTDSIAVKEYLLVEKKIYENKNNDQMDEVTALAIKAIYSPKFEQFLAKRKARLNISNRRIF